MVNPPPPAGLAARFKVVRRLFITDQIAQALEDATTNPRPLFFKENGMTDLTRHGQQVEDEATDAALEIFNDVLKGYWSAATGFNAQSLYTDEQEHALNTYQEGSSDAEQDALERISAAHGDFLQAQKQEQNRDLAEFLLKSPLEFADASTQDLLSKADQQCFSAILDKLRSIATV